jgi:hypothetical protein
MKYILLTFLLLCAVSSYSQSPGFDIILRFSEEMYHGDTCQSVYTLSVDKFFLKKSDETKRNWFGNDTSQYDWSSFSINETDNFEVKRIAEQTYNAYVSQFLYSQQDYVYENIVLFTVKREKCGITEVMKFYFPIKISSFVTTLNLRPVYFKPGIYNLTDAVTYFVKDNHYVVITLADNIKFENYKKE